jgi:hypothetical protein
MKIIPFLTTVAALLATALPSPAQVILYSNNFNQNGSPETYSDQNLSTVNFVGDVVVASTRVYSNTDGLTVPSWAVYSYAPPGATDGFYTAPDTLPPISVSAPELTFSVDIQSQFNPQDVSAYFAVETSNGQWYASSAAMPEATGSWTTESLAFSASASQWDLLTVGTPSGDATDAGATIGGAATSDLTGNIIAAGFVAQHFSAYGTVNFDNFTVTAAVPEPSTWALLLVGLSGLIFRLRRRT